MQKPRRFFHALIACLAIVVFACGDDLGDPDYSDQVGILPPDQKFEEPDPFQPGEERLSVDVFYEGGRSKTIKINGVRNNYFVFGLLELGRDSFAQGLSRDRLEGEESYSVTLVGTPFWGGGVIWEEAINLSEWAKLFVSFKSSDPSFVSFEISLLYEAEGMERSVVINPRDYGYANDGEWHSLEIPLVDAIRRGFDPTMVRSPFVIGAQGGVSGDQLLVDNLYLTKF